MAVTKSQRSPAIFASQLPGIDSRGLFYYRPSAISKSMQVSLIIAAESAAERKNVNLEIYIRLNC
jgi:hypothetical protein